MPLSAFVTADPHALTTNEDEIIFYNENAKVADMRLCKALHCSNADAFDSLLHS